MRGVVIGGLLTPCFWKLTTSPLLENTTRPNWALTTQQEKIWAEGPNYQKLSLHLYSPFETFSPRNYFVFSFRSLCEEQSSASSKKSRQFQTWHSGLSRQSTHIGNNFAGRLHCSNSHVTIYINKTKLQKWGFASTVPKRLQPALEKWLIQFWNPLINAPILSYRRLAVSLVIVQVAWVTQGTSFNNFLWTSQLCHSCHHIMGKSDFPHNQGSAEWDNGLFLHDAPHTALAKFETHLFP